MMMNRKRQLALVVVACFVGAGLLSLVPMGKPWQSQNTSTTNITAPTTLAIGAKTSFSFTNDTTVASFTVTLGNASPAVGEQYNLTVWAGNGTLLSAAVYQTQTYASGGNTWVQKTEVGNGIPSFGGVVNNAPSTVKNGSMLITVITQVTLCIQVSTSQSSYTFPYSPWTAWGGSIQITETSGYQKTMANTSPVSSGASFANNLVNVTGLYTPGVSNMTFAQEFNASVSGTYCIQVNATNTTIGSPDFHVIVLAKGFGVPDLLGSGIAGIYHSICADTHLNNLGGKYYVGIWLTEPLAANQQYVLYVYGITGILSFCNVTMVPVISGQIGTPTTIDFTSPSKYLELAGWNGYSYYAMVSFPTFNYDTVYSTSLTQAAWPWSISASNFFTLSEGNIFYAQNNMKDKNGSFLVTQNLSPAISVDNQAISLANPIINMQKVYFWDNVSGVLPYQYWDASGTISDSLWSHPTVLISATNYSVAIGGASNPGVVTLTVGQNATSVADFPGTPSVTDPTYSSNTFTYQNGGGQDMMGLYKINGKQGNEWQVQVTGFAGLNQNGLVTTNSYIIGLVTGNVFQGVQYGYKTTLPSQITNKTDTTGYLYGFGDSAKIFETALFSATTYVLITSGWNGYYPWINGSFNEGTPGGNLQSNSSSISLNWTIQPFLKSGDAFVVSRDNQIQCYDVDIPSNGLATLGIIYGWCDLASATVDVYPAPITASWVGHNGNTPTFSIPTITATTNGKTFSFCNGFPGYVVVETSSLTKGVVAKLTITSCVPIDWLAWGIALVAAVALVIVSILLAKKK